MIENHRRPDGRAFDQIRNITIEPAPCRARTAQRCSPAARPGAGDHHAGTKDDEQRIELIEPGESPSQALHAALQLPAVQRRRNGLYAGSGREKSATGRWPSARSRR